MKKGIALIILFLLLSCSKNPSAYIEYINGYWEIEEVQLTNGEKRIYSINQTIDYFKVNDSLRGIKKKLNVDLSGGFTASNHQEGFQLKLENDSLNIYYNSSFSKRKETIVFVNSKQLKIVTENKDVYLYKRFKPISIEN